MPALTDNVSHSYLELYLSTDPSSPYYFGDKSIVVHSTNTTRLTCANFVPVASGTTNSTTSSTSNSTTNSTIPPPKTSSPPAAYTGTADHLTLSGAMLGGALFAAFFFF